MVDKTIPTKDERTVVDVYDTTRDNLIRTVDEFAKAQPQYSQSISNLQLLKSPISAIRRSIHKAIK
jgi:hypothetical protein